MTNLDFIKFCFINQILFRIVHELFNFNDLAYFKWLILKNHLKNLFLELL